MSIDGRRRSDSPSAYVRPLSPLTSASDVVKRGCLFVKRPPTKRVVRMSFKTWQKRYLVLRDDWKDSGTTTLDIYDRESEVEAAMIDGKMSHSFLFASRPYTVDLRTVTNVEHYLESRSFMHALIIVRLDGLPVIVGAQSELEMKGWMAAIKLLADKASHMGASMQQRLSSSYTSHSVHEGRRPPRGCQSLATRLNRSTPQLFKVMSNGSLHRSFDRQISSSNILDQTTADNGYMDVVGSDAPAVCSPRTPATTSSSSSSCSSASDFPEYHTFKKIFSSSFFSNFGIHRESGTSKWRPFFKMNRKDSGFSESFDEPTSAEQCPIQQQQQLLQQQQSYRPPQDALEEEEDSTSSSPPPIPPRQLSVPFTPVIEGLNPWFVPSPPPRPPPRPIHTLSILSH